MNAAAAAVDELKYDGIDVPRWIVADDIGWSLIDWHTAATAAAVVAAASLLPKQFVVEFATDDDGGGCVDVTVDDNDDEWWWREVGKYMDEKFVAETLAVLTKLFTLNDEELLLFVACSIDNDDVVGGKIPNNFDDETAVLCEPTDMLLLLWLLWLLWLLVWLAFDILELSSSSSSSYSSSASISSSVCVSDIVDDVFVGLQSFDLVIIDTFRLLVLVVVDKPSNWCIANGDCWYCCIARDDDDDNDEVFILLPNNDFVVVSMAMVSVVVVVFTIRLLFDEFSIFYWIICYSSIVFNVEWLTSQLKLGTDSNSWFDS